MSTSEALPNATDRERLAMQLIDSDYRKAFVEAHAKDSIAFQVRMMRKAREWDQRQLAEHAFGDTKLQSMVSRYENPDYGRYSLNTLLELAAAFDVALIVHFAPFSELLDWDETPAERKLVPTPFQEELNSGGLIRQSRRRKPKAKALAAALSGPTQRPLSMPENVLFFPRPETQQREIGRGRVENLPFATGTEQGRP